MYTRAHDNTSRLVYTNGAIQLLRAVLLTRLEIVVPVRPVVVGIRPMLQLTKWLVTPNRLLLETFPFYCYRTFERLKYMELGFVKC